MSTGASARITWEMPSPGRKRRLPVTDIDKEVAKYNKTVASPTLELQQAKRTAALSRSGTFKTRSEKNEWVSEAGPEIKDIQKHLTTSLNYSVEENGRQRLEQLREQLDKTLALDADDPLFGGDDPILTAADFQMNQVHQVIGDDASPAHVDQESDAGETDLSKLPELKDAFLLEEGQAVSELEVYARVFDESLKLLPHGVEEIKQTLQRVMNYFVNKAARKGQHQLALEAATQQLDQRCQTAEHDVRELQKGYEELVQRLHAVEADKSNLEGELSKAREALAMANRQKLKAEAARDAATKAQKTTQQELLEVQEELKHTRDKMVHFQVVSQRLQTIADSATIKISTAEARVLEEVQHAQKLSADLSAVQKDLERRNQEYIKLQKESDFRTRQYEDRIQKLEQCLGKYGETTNYVEQKFGVDVKSAIMSCARLSRGEALHAQELDQVLHLLQQLSKARTQEEFQGVVFKDYFQVFQLVSKEVQAEEQRRPKVQQVKATKAPNAQPEEITYQTQAIQTDAFEPSQQSTISEPVQRAQTMNVQEESKALLLESTDSSNSVPRNKQTSAQKSDKLARSKASVKPMLFRRPSISQKQTPSPKASKSPATPKPQVQLRVEPSDEATESQTSSEESSLQLKTPTRKPDSSGLTVQVASSLRNEIAQESERPSARERTLKAQLRMSSTDKLSEHLKHVQGAVLGISAQGEQHGPEQQDQQKVEQRRPGSIKPIGTRKLSGKGQIQADTTLSVVAKQQQPNQQKDADIIQFNAAASQNQNPNKTPSRGAATAKSSVQLLNLSEMDQSVEIELEDGQGQLREFLKDQETRDANQQTEANKEEAEASKPFFGTSKADRKSGHLKNQDSEKSPMKRGSSGSLLALSPRSKKGSGKIKQNQSWVNVTREEIIDIVKQMPDGDVEQVVLLANKCYRYLEENNKGSGAREFLERIQVQQQLHCGDAQLQQERAPVETTDAQVQVNLFLTATNVDYYKVKIGELTRMLQSHGLIDSLTIQETQNQMDFLDRMMAAGTDQYPNEAALKRNVLRQADESIQKVEVVSADELRRYRMTKENLQTSVVKPEEKSKESSSSLSIDSFQHCVQLDQDLLKFVKQVDECKEVQTEADVTTEMTQTESLWQVQYKSFDPATIVLEPNPLDQMAEVPLFQNQEEEPEQLEPPTHRVQAPKSAKKQSYSYNQNLVQLQKPEFQAALQLAAGEERQEVRQDAFLDYLNQQNAIASRSLRSRQRNRAAESLLAQLIQAYGRPQFGPSAEDRERAKVLVESAPIRQSGLSSVSALSGLVLETREPLIKVQTVETQQSFVAKTASGDVGKKISRSMLDLHPKHGQRQQCQGDPLRLPSLEQFQVVHEIDRIHLRFNATAIIQNRQAQLFPCVVRHLNTRFLSQPDSQLQRNTMQLFKHQVAMFQLSQQTVKQGSDFELSLQNIMSQIPQKPKGMTLLPQEGERISFIRLDNCCVTADNQLQVFRLLEENGEPLKFTQVAGQNYVVVPLQQIKLKTLTWTVKMARKLLAARMATSCSQLVQNGGAYVTETGEKQDQFGVLGGQMNREHADSLAMFAFKFANAKYGHKTLVLVLIWTLVANLAYFQYESDELYLFARMFFGDLPSDVFLGYLELFRMTQTQPDPSENVIKPALVLVRNVPEIVDKFFPNWEPKRKYALTQSVFQLWQTQNKQETLEFTSLASILLYALLSYKRTAWQMANLLFESLQKPDAPVLGIKEFRQLCEVLIPQAQSRQIDELFYEFSEPVDAILDGREMTALIFQELFESSQLVRYASLSTELLKKKADSTLSVLIFQQAACYQEAKVAVGQLLQRLDRKGCQDTSLKAITRTLRSQMDVIHCDILGFDSWNALKGFQKVIAAALDAMMVLSPEKTPRIIASFVTALQGELGGWKDYQAPDGDTQILTQ